MRTEPIRVPEYDERIVPGVILEHKREHLALVTNTNRDQVTLWWLWFKSGGERVNGKTTYKGAGYYSHTFEWCDLPEFFTYVCHQDDAIEVPSLVVWPNRLTRCSIIEALEGARCYLPEGHYAGYFSNRNNIYNDYRCSVTPHKKLVVMPTGITYERISQVLKQAGCHYWGSHLVHIINNNWQLVDHVHKHASCPATFFPYSPIFHTTIDNPCAQKGD